MYELHHSPSVPSVVGNILQFPTIPNQTNQSSSIRNSELFSILQNVNTEDIQGRWQHTQGASIPAIISDAMSGMSMFILTPPAEEQLNTDDKKLLCHLN